jgi:hypothetical protein
MKRYTIPSLLLALLLLFSTFGYAQTIMLQENFEGAFPPPGWSVIDNVVGGTWQDNVTRGVPNYCAAGSGDCAVAHPGDTNGIFWDTELRTPPIDLTSAHMGVADLCEYVPGLCQQWRNLGGYHHGWRYHLVQPAQSDQ